MRLEDVGTRAAQRRVVFELTHVQEEPDIAFGPALDFPREPFVRWAIGTLRATPERAALGEHVAEQVGALQGHEGRGEATGARPGHDDVSWIRPDEPSRPDVG